MAGKKYPAILHPHGGPVWAYYGEFNHFSQLFAANGYVVLEPNPRGSTGYGQDYCKAIYADWGNKDYQDDMAMVDYAIAQGLADPDKLAVGDGRTAASRRISSLRRPRASRPPFPAPASAFFASLYGHDQYIRDYDTELGYPWKNRAVWDRDLAFLQSRKHHHADAVHGRRH